MAQQVLEVVAPELTPEGRAATRKGRHVLTIGGEYEDQKLPTKAQSLITRMILNSGFDLAQEVSDTARDVLGSMGIGETTTREEPNKGFLWNPWELTLPRFEHKNGNNEWENMGTGFLQMAIGMASLGGIASAAGRAGLRLTPRGAALLAKYDKLPKVLRGIGSGAVRGAATDVVGVDQWEGRMVDLADQVVKGVGSDSVNFEFLGPAGEAVDAAAESIVESMGGTAANIPGIGWLTSKEEDSALWGRFKNMVDGLAAGLIVDFGLSSARTVKLNLDLKNALGEYANEAGRQTVALQELVFPLSGDGADNLSLALLAENKNLSLANGGAPELATLKANVERAADKVREHSVWHGNIAKRLQATGIEERLAKQAAPTPTPEAAPAQPKPAETSANPVQEAELSPQALESRKSVDAAQADLDAAQKTLDDYVAANEGSTDISVRRQRETLQNDVMAKAGVLREAETRLQDMIVATEPRQVDVARVGTEQRRIRSEVEQLVENVADANEQVKGATEARNRAIKKEEKINNAIKSLEGLKNQSIVDELDTVTNLTREQQSTLRTARTLVEKAEKSLSSQEVLGLLELDARTVAELRFNQDRLSGHIDYLRGKGEARAGEADRILADATQRFQRIREIRQTRTQDLKVAERLGHNIEKIERERRALPDLQATARAKRSVVTRLQEEERLLIRNHAAETQAGMLKGKRGQIKVNAYKKKRGEIQRKISKADADAKKAEVARGEQQARIDAMIEENDAAVNEFFSGLPEPLTPAELAGEAPKRTPATPAEREAENLASPGVNLSSEEAGGQQVPRASSLSRKGAVDESGVEVRSPESIARQTANEGNASVVNNNLVVAGAPTEVTPFTAQEKQRFLNMFNDMEEDALLRKVDAAPPHVRQRLRAIVRLKTARKRLEQLAGIGGDPLQTQEFIRAFEAGDPTAYDAVMALWQAERAARVQDTAAGQFILGRALGGRGQYLSATEAPDALFSFAPGVPSPVAPRPGAGDVALFGDEFQASASINQWVAEQYFSGNAGVDVVIDRGLGGPNDDVPFLEAARQNADSYIDDRAQETSDNVIYWLEINKNLRDNEQQLVDLTEARKGLTDPEEIAQADSGIQAVEGVISDIRTQLQEAVSEEVSGSLVSPASYDSHLSNALTERILRLAGAPIERSYAALNFALESPAQQGIGLNLQGDTVFLNANRLVFDTVSDAAEIAARSVEGVIDPTLRIDAPAMPGVAQVGGPIEVGTRQVAHRNTVLWARLEDQIRRGLPRQGEKAEQLIGTLQRWANDGTELQDEIRRGLDLLIPADAPKEARTGMLWDRVAQAVTPEVPLVQRQSAVDTMSMLSKQVQQEPRTALALASELVARGEADAMRGVVDPEVYTTGQGLPLVASNQAVSLLGLADEIPVNMAGIRELLGSQATKADKKVYVSISRALKATAARQIEWTAAMQTILGNQAARDLSVKPTEGPSLTEVLLTDLKEGAEVDLASLQVDLTNGAELKKAVDAVSEATKARTRRARARLKTERAAAVARLGTARSSWREIQSPEWRADRVVRQGMASNLLGITPEDSFAEPLLNVWELAWSGNPARELEAQLAGEVPLIRGLARARWATVAAHGKFAAHKTGQALKNLLLDLSVKPEGSPADAPDVAKYRADSTAENADRAAATVENRATAAMANMGIRIVSAAKRLNENLLAIDKAPQRRLGMGQEAQEVTATQRLAIAMEQGDIEAAADASDDLLDLVGVDAAGQGTWAERTVKRVRQRVDDAGKTPAERRIEAEQQSKVDRLTRELQQLYKIRRQQAEKITQDQQTLKDLRRELREEQQKPRAAEGSDARIAELNERVQWLDSELIRKDEAIWATERRAEVATSQARVQREIAQEWSKLVGEQQAALQAKEGDVAALQTGLTTTQKLLDDTRAALAEASEGRAISGKETGTTDQAVDDIKARFKRENDLLKEIRKEFKDWTDIEADMFREWEEMEDFLPGVSIARAEQLEATLGTYSKKYQDRLDQARKEVKTYDDRISKLKNEVMVEVQKLKDEWTKRRDADDTSMYDLEMQMDTIASIVVDRYNQETEDALKGLEEVIYKLGKERGDLGKNLEAPARELIQERSNRRIWADMVNRITDVVNTINRSKEGIQNLRQQAKQTQKAQELTDQDRLTWQEKADVANQAADDAEAQAKQETDLLEAEQEAVKGWRDLADDIDRELQELDEEGVTKVSRLENQDAIKGERIKALEGERDELRKGLKTAKEEITKLREALGLIGEKAEGIDVDKIEGDFNELQERLNNQRQSIQSLQSREEGATKEINRLKEDRKKTQDLLREATAKASERGEAIRQFMDLGGQVNDALARSEAESLWKDIIIKQVTKNRDTWRGRAEASATREADLAQRVEYQRATIGRSNGDMQALQDTRADLEGKILEKNAQVRQLNRDNKELNQLRDLLERANSSLEAANSRVTVLEGEIQRTAGDKTGLEAQLKAAKQERKFFSDNKAELEGQVQNLETARAGDVAAMRTLTVELGELDVALTKANDALAAKQREINGLNETLTKTQEDLKTESINRENAEIQRDKLDERVKNLGTELDSLRNLDETNNNLLDEVLGWNDELLAQLEKANNRLDTLEDEGRSLRKELEKTSKRLVNPKRLQAATQKYKVAQERVSTLEKAETVSEGNLRAAKAEASTAQAEVERLQKQAAESRKNYNAADRRAKEWENRYRTALEEQGKVQEELTQAGERADGIQDEITASGEKVAEITEENAPDLSVSGAEAEEGYRQVEEAAYRSTQKWRSLESKAESLQNEAGLRFPGVTQRELTVLPVEFSEAKRARTTQLEAWKVGKDARVERRRSEVLNRQRKVVKPAKQVRQALGKTAQTVRQLQETRAAVTLGTQRRDAIQAEIERLRADTPKTPWQQAIKNFRLLSLQVEKDKAGRILQRVETREQQLREQAAGGDPTLRRQLLNAVEQRLDVSDTPVRADTSPTSYEQQQAQAEVDQNAMEDGVKEVNGAANRLAEGGSTARSVEATGTAAPADDGGRVVEAVVSAPAEDSEAVQVTAEAVVTSPDPEPSLPTTGSVADFPVNRIRVNQEVFQAPGGGGTVNLEQAYQPQQAKELQVWFDADGELGTPGATYLVNGHHRLESAINSVQDTVNVAYIPRDVAPTSTEATAVGALQNVVDRGGTSVDLAEALRGPGVTPAIRASFAKAPRIEQAVKLARVPAVVFTPLREGKVRQVFRDKALALGDRDLPPETLRRVWEAAQERNWSAARIFNAVWEVDIDAPYETGAETLASLFGAVDETQMQRRITIRAAIERNANIAGWKFIASSPQIRAVMDEMIPQMKTDNTLSKSLREQYTPRLKEAAQRYLRESLGIADFDNTPDAVTTARVGENQALEAVNRVRQDRGKPEIDGGAPPVVAEEQVSELAQAISSLRDEKTRGILPRFQGVFEKLFATQKYRSTDTRGRIVLAPEELEELRYAVRESLSSEDTIIDANYIERLKARSAALEKLRRAQPFFPKTIPSTGPTKAQEKNYWRAVEAVVLDEVINQFQQIFKGKTWTDLDGGTLFSGLPIPNFGQAIRDIQQWGIGALPLRFQLMFGELFTMADASRAWNKMKNPDAGDLTPEERGLARALIGPELTGEAVLGANEAAKRLALPEELVAALEEIRPNRLEMQEAEVLRGEDARLTREIGDTRELMLEIVTEEGGDADTLKELRNLDSSVWDEVSPQTRDDLRTLMEAEHALTHARGGLRAEAGEVLGRMQAGDESLPSAETVAMASAHVEQLGALSSPQQGQIDAERTRLSQDLREVRRQKGLQEIGPDALVRRREALRNRAIEIRDEAATVGEASVEMQAEVQAMAQQTAAVERMLGEFEGLRPLDELRAEEQLLESRLREWDRISRTISPARNMTVSGIPLKAVHRVLTWLDQLGMVPEARALTQDAPDREAQRAASWKALPGVMKSALNGVLNAVRDLAGRIKRAVTTNAATEAKAEQINHAGTTANRVGDSLSKQSGSPGVDGIEDEIRAQMPRMQRDRTLLLKSLRSQDPEVIVDAWVRIFGEKIDPVMSDKELTDLATAFVRRDGLGAEFATDRLQPLLEALTREGTATFVGARLQLSYETQLSARAADEFLNLGPTATDLERRLVTEAFIEQLSNVLVLQRAYRQVARGVGRTLRAARTDIVPAQILSENLLSAWHSKIREGDTRKVLGHKISPEMDAALSKWHEGESPDWADPKLLEELQALALTAKDMEVEPATGSIADQMEKAVNMGTQGLMAIRTANLLSAGTTWWVNTINGVMRVATLPIYAPFGAAVGDPRQVPAAVTRAGMTYVQILKQLNGAFKLGAHSFRTGVGLWDPAGTRVEGMVDAEMGPERMEVRPGAWDLNAVGSPGFREGAGRWSAGLNLLWQGLTSPLRMLSSADTTLKAVYGNAEHWVRLYDRALDALKRKRADDPGIYKEAARQADKLLKASQVDVLINPDEPRRSVNIEGGAQTNQFALRAGRAATFTDDMLANPDKRSYQRGLELAEQEGLKGEEASNYAMKYMGEMGGNRMPQTLMNATRALWYWPKALADLKGKPGVGTLVSSIATFLKTPTDIVKTTMRHTPAAPLVDTWLRDVTSEDMITRQRARGEVALGSLAIGGTIAAMNHLSNVEFTGAGPSEWQSRRKWLQQEGMAPFSYRTREDEESDWSEWTSYRWGEPYSSIVGAIADYRGMMTQMSEEEKESAGGFLVLQSLGRLAASTVGKTWFADIQEFVEMLQRLNSEGGANPPGRRSPIWRWFTRQATTYVPRSSANRRLIRDVGNVRRTTPASTAMGELSDDLKSVFPVPGWSETRPPVRDPLTGEIVNVHGLNGSEWQNSVWFQGVRQWLPSSAFQVASWPTDPVKLELAKVGVDMGSSSGGRAKSRFVENGRVPQNVMTHEEWTAWLGHRVGTKLEQNVAGGDRMFTLREWLEVFINSSHYQRLPAYEGKNRKLHRNFRAEALRKEINKYDKEADLRFLASPEGARINTNRLRFQDLQNKETDFLNKNVTITPEQIEAVADRVFENLTGNR